jgi:hypothetical protein
MALAGKGALCSFIRGNENAISTQMKIEKESERGEKRHMHMMYHSLTKVLCVGDLPTGIRDRDCAAGIKEG